MSEPLKAARAAVQRSDKAPRGPFTSPASAREVRELRAALRALIQHAEDVDRRLAGNREEES